MGHVDIPTQRTSRSSGSCRHTLTTFWWVIWIYPYNPQNAVTNALFYNKLESIRLTLSCRTGLDSHYIKCFKEHYIPAC